MSRVGLLRPSYQTKVEQFFGLTVVVQPAPWHSLPDLEDLEAEVQCLNRCRVASGTYEPQGSIFQALQWWRSDQGGFSLLEM